MVLLSLGVELNLGGTCWLWVRWLVSPARTFFRWGRELDILSVFIMFIGYHTGDL